MPHAGDSFYNPAKRGMPPPGGGARAHRAGVQLTQVLEARADLQDVGVMRQVVLAIGCRHPHPPMRNQSRSKAMTIETLSPALIRQSKGKTLLEM